MDKKRYSASEVAQILTNEGYKDVSKRTVNYYAFDMNMFEMDSSGKKSFSEEDVDKIKAIRLLKLHTNYTLNQIKTIISQYSLDEVKNMCIKSVMDTTLDGSCREEATAYNRYESTSNHFEGISENKQKTIKIDKEITLITNADYPADKLKAIIDFINKLS